mgnify:CR=1 FL=1
MPASTRTMPHWEGPGDVTTRKSGDLPSDEKLETRRGVLAAFACLPIGLPALTIHPLLRAEGAMNWTDTTHRYSLSNCQYLGRPCPAAERMLSRLTTALGQARTVTTDNFEIAGNCELTACDRPCQARFSASHDRIRIYCGISPEADQGSLDQFADALFCQGADSRPITRLPEYPCGLAQALPLSPQPGPAPTPLQSVTA